MSNQNSSLDKNALRALAQQMEDMGRFGDSQLVHVNDEEVALLKQIGAGTRNPHTGLLEFWYDTDEDSNWESVTNTVESVSSGYQGQVSESEFTAAENQDTLNDIGHGMAESIDGEYGFDGHDNLHVSNGANLTINESGDVVNSTDSGDYDRLELSNSVLAGREGLTQADIDAINAIYESRVKMRDFFSKDMTVKDWARLLSMPGGTVLALGYGLGSQLMGDATDEDLYNSATESYFNPSDDFESSSSDQSAYTNRTEEEDEAAESESNFTVNVSQSNNGLVPTGYGQGGYAGNSNLTNLATRNPGFRKYDYSSGTGASERTAPVTGVSPRDIVATGSMLNQAAYSLGQRSQTAITNAVAATGQDFRGNVEVEYDRAGNIQIKVGDYVSDSYPNTDEGFANLVSDFEKALEYGVGQTDLTIDDGFFNRSNLYYKFKDYSDEDLTSLVAEVEDALLVSQALGDQETIDEQTAQLEELNSEISRRA